MTAPGLDRLVPRVGIAAAFALLAVACASPAPPAPERAFATEAADETDPVRKTTDIPTSFSQNEVMSDAFFTDVDWIDAEGLRTFFADVPGAGRSWLDGATVDGRDAASLIVEVARAAGVNPAVLTVRMQVEASAVSPVTRPSAGVLSALMGCGCPDGRACDSRFAGFRAQLVCAAQTFRALYDESKSGVGQWRVGRTTISLDGYAITPRTHATAAHYAYTPWVLPGRGGNWLAWRVARDYIAAMRSVRTVPAPACATFADVGPEHPAHGAVEAGVAAGYWSGCAADRFCPGDGLSRAAAASMLARVVAPRRVSPDGRFADVPTGHWAAGAITSLAAAGLVSGCGGGKFCPDQPVTRAELAALLARATDTAPVTPRGLYADLPASHWAAGVVEALAPTAGLGTCAPGRFCPDAAVSRGQTAIAFARVFGLSPVEPCR
jgi:hypothetical protein